MRETYYKCPKCNSLTTQSIMNEEMETMGGGDFCYCQFSQPILDKTGKQVDIEYTRILIPYKRITKKEYDSVKRRNEK
jgi:hypothetical protein